MSFWEGYWKTLKSREVEEPVDVWIHRPLAYLLALALRPTPISPNLVTLGSILLGLVALGVGFTSLEWRFQIAALLIFCSAVFDCADGQLARMRGTSSALGRMLDGSADLVVSAAMVIVGVWQVWGKYAEPWALIIALSVSVVAAVTSSFHTTIYDHFKNIYLRFTVPGFKEGESYAAARLRYESDPPPFFAARLAWPIYLFYVRSQEDTVKRYDPYTVTEMERLPAHDTERAAIYRRHALAPMRLWRGFFGFGSLVFGVAVSVALGIPEWYMAVRLTLLNAIFYGYLRPLQREASRQALSEMQLDLGKAV